MSQREDDIRRALAGEGPLFEAMLDERARELAVQEAAEDSGHLLTVLVMCGQGGGRWALPLTEVARVEPLPRTVAVPLQLPGIMGLAMLAGRRCLLADLAVLIAGAPVREREREGHAVLLRHLPLALAVDRVEDITAVAAPRIGEAGGVLADGTVLLDVGRLAARTGVGGSGG